MLWFTPDESPLRAKFDDMEVWGIFPYGSTFQGNITRMHSNEISKYFYRVLNFKRSGKDADFFRSEIVDFFERNGCTKYATIPGHKPESEGRLVEMFGRTFKRTKEVQPRKYNHSGRIDPATVELVDDVKGEKVLLLDDICTTGTSLRFYRKALLDAGAASVVCLVLGLNTKLAPLRDLSPEEIAAEKHPEAQEEPDEDAAEKPDEPLGISEVMDITGMSRSQTYEHAKRGTPIDFGAVRFVPEIVNGIYRFRRVEKVAAARRSSGGRNLHEMSLDELKAEKLAIEIEDRLRDRERHDVEIMEATEARVEAAFTKAVGRLVEWIRDNLPAEFVEKFGAALQAMKKELKNAVEIQEASSSGEDAASGE